MRHELTFSSLFSYCPKRRTGEGLVAIAFMKCLKNNWPVGGESPSIIVARNLNKILQTSDSLRRFFHSKAILVPVPRSSPIIKGGLWPSLEIARSMQGLGLGRVSTLLERVRRVRRSSMSRPGDRPTPAEHHESLSVTKALSDVGEVVLVDDVVTRGHTFMRCAWRIEEAYPGVRIHAFAAIRTVSDEKEFSGLYGPVELGTITYRRERNDCLRRP